MTFRELVAALALSAFVNACSSPTPSTSSSTHWMSCKIDDDCDTVPNATTCAVGYCADSSGGRITQSLTTQKTCDPVAVLDVPVVLGRVLGVGSAPDGTTYVVDVVTRRMYRDELRNMRDGGSSMLYRVFVSKGDVLARRSNALDDYSDDAGHNYEIDFDREVNPDAGVFAAPERMMLQTIGGKTTLMGLAETGLIGFDPTMITTPFTVDDPSTVSTLKLADLPGIHEVQSISDLSDGTVLVVTVPYYDYSEYGYRLFWGPPSSLKERHVIDATRDGSDMRVTFETGTDGAALTLHLNEVPVASRTDGGPVTVTAGTLEGPGTKQTLDVRMIDVAFTQGESALRGLSFTCL
ncbi:MAG TPA: hypothetical protein VH062_26035 [Polyangiaceae bacterium]|nr:hypothetical protein [Polyangiaceae bacterium]